MVSGLVTSPCDQLRIFSGEAREMRMASKSAITFAISNGLERNKVFLRFSRLLRRRLRLLKASLVVGPSSLAKSHDPRIQEQNRGSGPQNPKLCVAGRSRRTTS